MAAAASALHHLRHQAAKQHELVPLPSAPPGQQGGGPPTTATGRASPGGNSSRKARGSSGEQQPQGSAVAATAKGTGPATAASAAAAAAAAFHCPICLDAAPEGRLCVTTCGHTFCIECIHDLVDRRLGKAMYPQWIPTDL